MTRYNIIRTFAGSFTAETLATMYAEYLVSSYGNGGPATAEEKQESDEALTAICAAGVAIVGAKEFALLWTAEFNRRS